jgi:hypothetical protein
MSCAAAAPPTNTTRYPHRASGLRSGLAIALLFHPPTTGAKKMTDLVVVDTLKAVQVFAPGGIERLLAKVTADVRAPRAASSDFDNQRASGSSCITSLVVTRKG